MAALSAGKIRFWHLMVGVGFGLVIIGLVMIFLPPELGESGSFVIEFFEARFEGTEMGLALIVLGLSCFLIGRKDLGDLRTYQAMQEELNKNNHLTAKLVANSVEQGLTGDPEGSARLTARDGLDVVGTRDDLRALVGRDLGRVPRGEVLHQAEKGLALLEALERSKKVS
jgi:hypothetical protein